MNAKTVVLRNQNHGFCDVQAMQTLLVRGTLLGARNDYSDDSGNNGAH